MKTDATARTNVTRVDPAEWGWPVGTQVRIKSTTLVINGVTLTVREDRGGTFTVRGGAVSERTGERWVDLTGGAAGRTAWRSVAPERLVAANRKRVRKRTRARGGR